MGIFSALPRRNLPLPDKTNLPFAIRIYIYIYIYCNAYSRITVESETIISLCTLGMTAADRSASMHNQGTFVLNDEFPHPASGRCIQLGIGR